MPKKIVRILGCVVLAWTMVLIQGFLAGIPLVSNVAIAEESKAALKAARGAEMDANEALRKAARQAQRAANKAQKAADDAEKVAEQAAGKATKKAEQAIQKAEEAGQ